MGTAASEALPTSLPDRAVLEAIRSRRVTRRFAETAVDPEVLGTLVEAARWASRGGNRLIHQLLVIQNPEAIRLVRAFSPGMHGVPTALVVICTNGERAAAEEVQLDRHTTTWIDVGTLAMTMMLAAQAAGLGSCPTTSFSRGGVAAVLELPAAWTPELILQLGYPAPNSGPPARRPTRRALEDFVHWEKAGCATLDGGG